MFRYPQSVSQIVQKMETFQQLLVHKSTISKTLKKNGVHGRRPQWKVLLSKKKKNIAACLKLAKEDLIFCGQMKTKLDCVEGAHGTM